MPATDLGPRMTTAIDTHAHALLAQELNQLVASHTVGWVLEALAEVCNLRGSIALTRLYPPEPAVAIRWHELAGALGKLCESHCKES